MDSQVIHLQPYILKIKEFKDLVGIEDDKIEFKDGIEFDEKDLKPINSIFSKFT